MSSVAFRFISPVLVAMATAGVAAAQPPSSTSAARDGAAGEARPSTALATAVVAASREGTQAAYEGVVQAVRQTVLAAQVPGAVVDLRVKPGDAVEAGQVLVRLDAREAQQAAAASAAQVQAARAAQEAATREYERQKQLFEKRYISQAALDRAEAQYKAAQAQAAAMMASAQAATTQSGYYVVKAPYAGVIAEVPVVLGDMAMPGRPLVTLYDPVRMRVSVPLPQGVASRWSAGTTASIEIPGLPAERVAPVAAELLPAVDPSTHTQELRLTLPAGLAVRPGSFARVWLPLGAQGDRAAAALLVPAQAVVRRAELTGVYVLSPEGRPLLRQVRLGRRIGDQVEVLSGVSAGERVVLDAQAASRVR